MKNDSLRRFEKALQCELTVNIGHDDGGICRLQRAVDENDGIGKDAGIQH